jgi:hypothetical protein
MPFSRLLIVSLLMLLAGCASQVPLAANHPLSSQKKARAVHHWDVLADDVTTQTFVALRKAGIAEGTPLYVAHPTDTSVFAKAFRTLLITRMVGRGLPVLSEPSLDAIELHYETQLVRHNSSRYAHAPGTFTALAAGIWVVRDMIIGDTAAMPAGLALGALADYGAGHFAGGPTATELLVTSSISLDYKYLMRKSDIYYIEDADVSLFVDTCAPADECAQQLFAAPKQPPARPVRELKVKELEIRELKATCDRYPCQPTAK